MDYWEARSHLCTLVWRAVDARMKAGEVGVDAENFPEWVQAHAAVEAQKELLERLEAGREG
jgi:hypothetical protein